MRHPTGPVLGVEAAVRHLVPAVVRRGGEHDLRTARSGHRDRPLELGHQVGVECRLTDMRPPVVELRVHRLPAPDEDDRDVRVVDRDRPFPESWPAWALPVPGRMDLAPVPERCSPGHAAAQDGAVSNVEAGMAREVPRPGSTRPSRRRRPRRPAARLGGGAMTARHRWRSNRRPQLPGCTEPAATRSMPSVMATSAVSPGRDGRAVVATTTDDTCRHRSCRGGQGDPRAPQQGTGADRTLDQQVRRRWRSRP